MSDEKFYKNLKNLANITNFGVSMVSPLIICLLGGTWLRDKFDLGDWIMLLAIVLGIGGGISSFYSFYQKMKK